MPVHPPGLTTHVSGISVEGKTRSSWAGFPTLILKDDHEPSLPPLKQNDSLISVYSWGDERPTRFEIELAYNCPLGTTVMGAASTNIGKRFEDREENEAKTECWTF